MVPRPHRRADHCIGRLLHGHHPRVFVYAFWALRTILWCPMGHEDKALAIHHPNPHPALFPPLSPSFPLFLPLSPSFPPLSPLFPPRSPSFPPLSPSFLAPVSAQQTSTRFGRRATRRWASRCSRWCACSSSWAAPSTFSSALKRSARSCTAGTGASSTCWRW